MNNLWFYGEWIQLDSHQNHNLLLFVTGGLSPLESRLVEEHLAVCAVCRDELLLLREGDHLLKRFAYHLSECENCQEEGQLENKSVSKKIVKLPAMPEYLRKAIQKKYEQKASFGVLRFLRSKAFYPWMKAIPAAAIIMVIGLFFWKSGPFWVGQRSYTQLPQPAPIIQEEKKEVRKDTLHAYKKEVASKSSHKVNKSVRNESAYTPQPSSSISLSDEQVATNVLSKQKTEEKYFDRRQVRPSELKLSESSGQISKDQNKPDADYIKSKPRSVFSEKELEIQLVTKFTLSNVKVKIDRFMQSVPTEPTTAEFPQNEKETAYKEDPDKSTPAGKQQGINNIRLNSKMSASRETGRTKYNLDVVVITEELLDSSKQQQISQYLVDTLYLDVSQGDLVRFLVHSKSPTP